MWLVNHESRVINSNPEKKLNIFPEIRMILERNLATI